MKTKKCAPRRRLRGAVGTGVVLFASGWLALFSSSLLTAVPADVVTADARAQTRRNKARRAPGAILETYDVGPLAYLVPLVEGQKPNHSRRVASLDLEPDSDIFGLADQFLAEISGELRIAKKGEYRFRITSDDGSTFELDRTLLIDNDGHHAATSVVGKVALRSGWHPFRIRFFDAGGAHVLKLEWRIPGAKKFVAIPAAAIFGPADFLHETTPGRKEIVQSVNDLEAMNEEDAIGVAIDRGIEYLLEQVARSQTHRDDRNEAGQVALETYALVVAGVSIEHPLIRSNFAYLASNILKEDGKKRQETNTYAVACYVFALDAAIAQMEYDALLFAPAKVRERFVDDPRIGKPFRGPLKKAVAAMLGAQNATGGWHYTPSQPDADSSCTQFAALALGVGAKRRVSIDPRVWFDMARYYYDMQADQGPVVDGRLTLDESMGDNGLTLRGPGVSGEGDKKARGRGKGKRKDKGKGKRGGTGVEPESENLDPVVGTESLEVRDRGFKYAADRELTWNMSCSGLSSLLIIRQQIKRALRPEKRRQLDEAIRDGYGYLLNNWTPTASYYGIYSLEKVADLGHVRLFDGKDWYQRVSSYLVKHQRPKGNWPTSSMHGENSRVTTSFALLVLNRATSLLTQNPASRVILTGGHSEQVASENRDWVFLPDLGTSVHFPSVMRQVRLRPHRKLLQVTRTLCENYPPIHGHELVRALLELRKHSELKAVKKAVASCLDTICGVELADDGAYLDWIAASERALEIADSNAAEAGPELVALYNKFPRSLPFKRRVLHAMVRLSYQPAAAVIVVDLLHKDSDYRASSYRAIVGLLGSGAPAFDPKASRGERGKAQAALQTWIQKRLARSR